MARVRRAPAPSGTRVPLPPITVRSGFPYRPTHRAFVMVSEPIFADFHRRWREIDRRYPTLGVEREHWDAVTELRWSARKSLREEVRRDALFAAGPYMIPV